MNVDSRYARGLFTGGRNMNCLNCINEAEGRGEIVAKWGGHCVNIGTGFAPLM
jgi:hypothetical protein